MNTKLIEEMKKVAKGESSGDFDSETADAMILKKSVRKKKGKWWQVPKNL